MSDAVSSPGQSIYDILIEDADGRKLLLERSYDLGYAKRRLQALSAEHAGIRLILWNQQARTVVAETDGY